ncbi:hypothetical protein PSHT_05296 [Puccinia striiformis]|uniref:Uncharacterized protein n=1 Tax=Puccinia striiformis TaxID=27350 RepID=A0A2S4WAV7_9BASI|nr:hypothetical protein PSHT_05296 [Puccinia striiformis]
MPDNANPILKSNSTSTGASSNIPSQSSLSSSKVTTEQERRRSLFLNRVQQATSTIHEDRHYLDSLDLFDEEDDQPNLSSDLTQKEEEERIDSEEIFVLKITYMSQDLIRSITDPEHPLTLEDLSVVSPEQITVTYPIDDEDDIDDRSESSPHVMVRFTPTIPHCSMATLIGMFTTISLTILTTASHFMNLSFDFAKGLTLRVRLLRSLPSRFKVDIKIKEGTHQSENSVNKFRQGRRCILKSYWSTLASYLESN